MPNWNPEILMKENESFQPIYRTKVEGIDIMVPMRDGTRLAVDNYRPDAEGGFRLCFRSPLTTSFCRVRKSGRHAVTSLLGHPFGVARPRPVTLDFLLQGDMSMSLEI
jgi:hypothetical protein